MPEHIINTFHFVRSKTGVDFGPDQIFEVSSEVVFSAVRVTVLGQTDGRHHDINLSFMAGLSGIGAYVNSIVGDVPDNTPTIKGPQVQLSRLVPEISYRVELIASNFSPGEEVVITVEMLALDSTVAEVTRAVLREAETPDPDSLPGPDVNALAFGFSEASIAHLMQPHRSQAGVELGPLPFLKVVLSMVPYWEPWYPITQIDVVAEELVINGYVKLEFIRSADLGGHPQPVAEVVAQVSVRCRPAMVTTTKDTLQLQFVSAQVVGGLLSVKIPDPSVITDVLSGGFASIDDFKNTVLNDYLHQITTKTGKLGFALPAYLETRPLPDYWHRVLNMRLEFLRFQYKTVKVHERNVAYLFVVFAMESLDLPPPCFCEEPSLVGPPDDDDADDDDDPPEVQTGFTSDGQPEPSSWEKVLPPPHANYTDILAASQVMAFGMSQRSFREAAKPYANFGHDQTSSVTLPTGIYTSVRFWYRITLNTAEITRDGVMAVIDGAGEGTAKAGIRDKCGSNVLSVSERMRITLHDNSITWRPKIRDIDGTTPRSVAFIAEAKVRLSRPDIDLDLAGGPPPPLDAAMEWVTEEVLHVFTRSMEKMAGDQLSIHLIRTALDTASVRLRFVDNRFFEGEAAVVLGQLSSRTWG